MESWESHVTRKTRGANEPKESTSCMFSAVCFPLYVFRCMFVHKVLFEFLEFKHPRLLLVSTSDTSTGGGLLGVKFLASENWCGRVHFGGHSPEWRVLAKFSVQPWYTVLLSKLIIHL